MAAAIEGLPLKQKLKLLRQGVYAAFSFRGHAPVSVRADPLGAVITVDGKSIYAPSPLRWKLYKKGWTARLDQLAREYGVGRHISLDQDSVILDIGANAGEFAYVAARHGARIHCIEPDPKVFACLSANTSDLSDVSIHDALIWKENGEVDFFSAPDTADSSVFDEGQGEKVTKPAVTVERFCTDHGIERLDLLKCDAEGAEPEILEGIGAMFAQIKVIALDTGPERKGARTHHECRRILEENGFSVIDEKIGKRLMTFGVNRSALK
ncbi:FkbM family methyltransferase [Hyphococcus sp.]|uniref:FkbM family methyltransferase n=1 Tax=Hyphococcus sp. TaxID=2038636 RepID=UPI0035C73719